jgi:hypothetical protein
MVRTDDLDFDEDAALEALWESLGAPHPRDVLGREDERERELKGHPLDVALEKWGPMIEEMIERDLAGTQLRWKTSAHVLPLVRPQKNPEK